MGFIAQAIEARATASFGHPIDSISDPSWMTVPGVFHDATSQHLREHEVIGWPAVLQAMRVISWAIAMLPMPLYERVDGGKQKVREAKEHPLYHVLSVAPNPEQTPFEFKAGLMMNALLRGNSYSQVLRDKGKMVRAIWPLQTERMIDVRRRGGWLEYTYEEETRRRVLLTNRDNGILHVRGFSDGGILGYAMTRLAATTFGKGVAMDRFGAKAFASGMNATAVVESEQPHTWKTDDEKKRFFDKIKEGLAGADNWHTVVGLPYGMKMRTLGVSAKDAQLLEGMTFQVQEVARIFGVPPHLLMELSKATFSNIEHQMLQFIQLTLGPWFTNLEQRFMAVLLTPAEREKYFVEFLVDALLKTDIKTRYDALRIAIGQPFMSVNEGRDKLNMDPVEGGDDIPKPANMLNPGGDPALSPDAGDASGVGVAPPQDGDADTRGRAGIKNYEFRIVNGKRRVSVARLGELRASNVSRRTLRAAYRRTITRDAGRLVKAEIREVRKMLSAAGVEDLKDGRDGRDGRKSQTGMSAPHCFRDADGLASAIEGWFTGKGFEAAFERTLGPTLRDYASAMAEAAAAQAGGDSADVGEFLADYLKGFVERTAGGHSAQLLKLIRETDAESLYKVIDGRLNEWDGEDEHTGQAEKIGARESVQLGEAVARAAWAVVGVTELVWVTQGGSCPICDELDGQVVGIEEVFVEASGEVDPADDTVTPVRPRSNVFHPPLHNGCECELAAA